ncbi:hypothetical protein Tco_0847219 [Tanacetum coccineum]
MAFMPETRPMFTITIQCHHQEQDTQCCTLLSAHEALTNEDIRKHKSYKEYYAIAFRKDSSNDKRKFFYNPDPQRKKRKEVGKGKSQKAKEETNEDDTFNPIVHTPSCVSSSDDEDSDNKLNGWMLKEKRRMMIATD